MEKQKVFVVLASSTDTSGGSAPYSYCASFLDKEQAKMYAALKTRDEKKRTALNLYSWIPEYSVFKKI